MSVSLSPDCLSVREIRRRLSALDDATCHLKSSRQMPPDNPWNREVTLADVARYLGMHRVGKLGAPGQRLRKLIREDAPPGCPFDCGKLANCHKAPPCRMISGAMQQRLSDILRGLDAGTIRKVRLGDDWRLVEFPKGAHASLAKMVTAQGPSTEARSFTGRVELTLDGPRLKL
jgi:hypothetical protein